jgi:hypothetical protein
MTLFLAFSLFDAQFFSGLISTHAPAMHAPPPLIGWLHYAIGGAVVLMSVPVVINMLSARQVMNSSFNTFHLVGTYGAFGSITRPRYEVIVEGTDEAVLLPSTLWREYQFKGKPGALDYRPPQIAPYHLRLDWLMWFAAMSDYQDYPWFVNFVAKLLEGDPEVLGLLRQNPFPQHPPRHVRAMLYEYHFTTPDEHRRTGNWWKRTLTRPYFPAVSLEDPSFRQILRNQGWVER